MNTRREKERQHDTPFWMGAAFRNNERTFLLIFRLFNADRNAEIPMIMYYRIERMDYGVIGAPKIFPVPLGTFASWMKSRGKLGGQNKVPRVINDTKLFTNLEQFARNIISSARD